ncbi:MAG: aldehyde dehydrogenase family protein [Bacteroidota bacterium]
MTDLKDLFQKYNIDELSEGCSTGSNWFGSGEVIESYSPVDGNLIRKVKGGTKKEFDEIVKISNSAFKKFREIPAPKRGELVRQFGNKLREEKELIGKLVSYEMGKSYQEGLGEVQEMIDICDFAVGLSRQLHGLTMHSERPTHRMYEQYHPLGIIGIISAFNFPVAVWSWNVALSWICGNTTIWKPSEKTPLCSLICQKIIGEVFKENDVPEGVSCLINGDYKIGELLSESREIPLISATGSTRMGRIVAEKVGSRLGKTLLELGGNNAIIVTPDADLKMTIMGAVFGAVGTCGQRCTSTRRLIVHKDIYDKVKEGLLRAYDQIKIGDPLDSNNHVGPLIDKDAVSIYKNALESITEQGGKFLIKGGVLSGDDYKSGCYVKPAIAEVDHSIEIVHKETFAPILYLIKYSGNVENAINIQNEVDQGLSSAIMTNNLKEAEIFLSHWGSDCGIANVNIGTSGAEIGGAFGGEKDTGGGRESGSDAWKIYMRRQTNTINFSSELPLAQGIKFDIT